VSGTDPNGKWFGKQGERTEPFHPDGVPPGQELPKDLPKIPGITLHYEIARGGMGVVYSGRQDFLDRRVAVKFLSVDLGGDAFAQRFQREAKILAGISHPNIVGCHMADTTPEGQSYLVMEFCDGPSLKAWIADNGPIEPMAAIRLIRSSALALAHAHQSDIIHRDVKPENILLESVTSTTLDIRFPFAPKIVDLGLARMTHEQVGMGLTSPGSVMGTPSTMSPEQFDDPDSVDFRSDIYGLGCCLYEMLVGQPAFRGNKLTDIVLRKRDASSPNPCDENPNLPAAVGAFTQRLLASNRDDRPASYKELDQEANELMTVLLASRGKSSPPPAAAVDGPRDILDQTVPSGGANRPGGPSVEDPFANGMDATMPMGAKPRGTQPPAGQGAGTQPTEQPKANTSPGMLNTGEFAFLSEGGPAGGAESAAPAFQESGASNSDTAATNPVGTSGGAGSKKGLYIGIGGAVVIAVVLAVVFGMGGDKPGDNANGNNSTANGNGNGNDTRPSSAKTNSAPTIASLKLLKGGKESDDVTVDLDALFGLVVSASDQDGDELRYKWSWPDGVLSPMSQTGAATIKFRLVDGLPGVEHVVRVEVSDDDATVADKREFRIVVGECPQSLPLIGFQATGIWGTPVGTWREIMDAANPANRGVSGRVRSIKPVMATKLPTDKFWEWSGTLVPTAEADGEAAAQVAISFGDKGYAIQCSVAKDETQWTIEVREQVPGQDAWRPLAPPCKSVWTQPAESDGTNRGWFSVRRLGGQLVLEVGEFAQPAPVPGEPLAEPTISRKPAVTVDLTEEDRRALAKGGSLKLMVTKSRCEFRAALR
tara:strand:- start:18975 stop:21443 length:2469 start_codon:yes stop_codon:yes gene_type:complete